MIEDTEKEDNIGAAMRDDGNVSDIDLLEFQFESPCRSAIFTPAFIRSVRPSRATTSAPRNAASIA